MAEDKAILIKTAYGYYQRGDWDRAIEEYHKLADLDPGDLNVLNILADIYAKKGDTVEALRQYDLVAQGFDQKNQVDKVLQVYKRMLKLAPDRADLQAAVKNLVGKYLERAAQLEEQEPARALEVYRSILKAEPNRPDASLRYARLLMKSGEKFQAIETLMVLADELDPETQTGRLAEVLQQVADWDPLHVEARERLVELHTKAKDHPRAVLQLRALTEIYLSKNDFAKAEETAQRALDLGDRESYYHLGVIHFNQERYADARLDFERFLEVFENHVGALKYLALTHLRLNQNTEAVRAYRLILNVYVNENLLEEARELRQTILELDPQNDVRGLDLGDGGAAVPGEVTAPSEGGGDDETFKEQALREAEEYASKGLYDQAVDIYLEMLKRWPEDRNIRTALQHVYALMVRSAEPPPSAGPDPEALKADLERQLREQMERELEEQRRRLVEEQERLGKAQASEIESLKKEYADERRRLMAEMEARLREQMDQNRMEEERRKRLLEEFEARQRALLEEKERLESIHRSEKSALEEEIRRKVEQEIREKLEREVRERLEREAAERESRLSEEMRRQAEEEERQKREFERREAEKRKAQDRINREIQERMERLRREKERETSAPTKTPEPVSSPPAEPRGGVKDDTLEDPFVRQTLADIYARQGMFVEAVKIYEKILTENPENEEVRDKLRDLLRQKGI